MKVVRHLVANRSGWHLSLTQTYDPAKLVATRPPVLIVPGYGMNSFIFSYHPNGVSLEGYLCQRGFEVWRCDLRAQGESVRVNGKEDYRLEDLVLDDLDTVIHAALERTRSQADRLMIIGASLGGTLSFAYLSLVQQHRVQALVTMGSPVRWVKVHPLVKTVFVSPMLAGLVRVRGTRRLAEAAVPLLVRHSPWLISIYMNPELTDTRAIKDMVRTVEDPSRSINKELARWIKQRDLVVRGVNVAESLRALRLPFLCVAGHGDGVVPRETATFPYAQMGSPDKELLVVGDDTVALAHADLFISNGAHERVFKPVAEWLERRG